MRSVFLFCYTVKLFNCVTVSENAPTPSWKTLEESKIDMLNRALPIMHNLYARDHVDYTGNDYEKEIILMDSADVKVAFKYFDHNGNGLVTKNEMMEATEKGLSRTSLRMDTIASEKFMLIYLSRYWHFTDRDASGSLDYFEFRNFFANWIDIMVQEDLKNDVSMSSFSV